MQKIFQVTTSPLKAFFKNSYNSTIKHFSSKNSRSGSCGCNIKPKHRCTKAECVKTYEEAINRCRFPRKKCGEFDEELPCDPFECWTLKRVDERRKVSGNKTKFRSCMPFENTGYGVKKSKCEMAEYKKCYRKDPENAHVCHRTIKMCMKNKKTYPVETFPAKPKIPGHPIMIKENEKYYKEV